MLEALCVLSAFSIGVLLTLVLSGRFQKPVKVKLYEPIPDVQDSKEDQRGSNGVLYLHGRSGPMLVPADADPNDPCCQVPPEDLELPEHSEVKKNNATSS